MPPQRWGLPPYHDLYVGLCQALSRPWQSAAARAPVAQPDQAQTKRNVWRLVERHRSGADAIEAASLDDLRRAVRDYQRIESDDSLASSAASLAGNIE